MKILKIRDTKLPERWTDISSWIDIFLPNDFIDLYYSKDCFFTPSEYIEDQDRLKDYNFFIESEAPIINIPAWYGIKIPSWLKVLLDKGTDMVLTDKSGVCVKLWLINWACVIDADYRWEFSIHLINTSKFNVQLTPWQKITQGIIRKVELQPIFEVDEEYYKVEWWKTERGEWGFGSTWTK